MTGLSLATRGMISNSKTSISYQSGGGSSDMEDVYRNGVLTGYMKAKEEFDTTPKLKNINVSAFLKSNKKIKTQPISFQSSPFSKISITVKKINSRQPKTELGGTNI